MEATRRDFLDYLIGGAIAGGILGFTYPIIKSLAPSEEDIKTAVVRVNISDIDVLGAKVVSWKGKPVIVMKLPEGFEWKGEVKEDKNYKLLKEHRVFALIGICTHLGCIPLWRPKGDADYHQPHLHCPCHGGIYTPWGDVVAGPPPASLHLPPQRIEGNMLVIGEPGFIKGKA